MIPLLILVLDIFILVESKPIVLLSVGVWIITWYDYGQSSPPDGSFIDISSGYRHTCGIKIDGTVECWGNDDGGYNDYGQTSPPSDLFIDISVGYLHTCRIQTDGTIKCWGAGKDKLEIAEG